jgi:hypothetical protein
MQGWSNPITGISQPNITQLSSNKGHATLLTLVAVLGSNFRPYSTIKFGVYNPNIIFINSEHIEFYVPLIVTTPSTFTVQVFNASIGSNVVNFQIESAINFWLFNTETTKLENISNSNGLEISGNVVVKKGNISGDFISNNIVSYNSADTTNVNTVDTDLSQRYLNSEDTIDSFKPVKYYSNQTHKFEIGFYTDQIPDAYKFLISPDDTSYPKTINYTGIIGLLVNEIKELKKRVTQLET